MLCPRHLWKSGTTQVGGTICTMITRLFAPLAYPCAFPLSRRIVLQRWGSAGIGASAALAPILIRAQEATPASDVAANIALARSFYELYQLDDLAAADEILAPDFTWYSPPQTRFLAGADETKQLVTGLREFFLDLVITENDVIAAGDRVVVRWTLTGTAQTEHGGVPVIYTGIDIYRIADGKIVELWQNTDDLGLEQQLGNVPADGTPVA